VRVLDVSTPKSYTQAHTTHHTHTHTHMQTQCTYTHAHTGAHAHTHTHTPIYNTLISLILKHDT